MDRIQHFESYTLTIITTHIFDSRLTNYASKWRYNLSEKETNDKYHFYLKDDFTNINLNQSLDDIIHTTPWADKIYINKKKSFISQKNIEYHDFSIPHTNIAFTKGFPEVKEGYAIINVAYFDEIFHNKKIPFERPCVIPEYIPAKIKSGDALIPKVIFNTFQYRSVGKPFMEAIIALLEKNPEYSYKYYSDRDCREYIKKYFNKNILKAYDILLPGAFKADLWRYCVIYNEGGVYMDIKFICIKQLKEIIDSDTYFLIDNDRVPHGIHNAFFASASKNPLLLKCIKTVFENVEKKFYGTDCLQVTGPMMMGRVVYSSYDIEDRLSPGTYILKNKKVQIYRMEPIPDDKGMMRDGYGAVFDKDNNIVMKTRHNEKLIDRTYVSSLSGEEHYSNRWDNRDIFKKMD